MAPLSTCSAEAAARFLTERWRTSIDAVIVTGSGFNADSIGEDLDVPISYHLVPGMPHGNVDGHAHVFRLVRLNGQSILLCSGRFHLYEGLSVDACGIFMHIASLMRVRRAVLMNAVGGLNPSYSVGDIVLVDDVIDLTFSSLPQTAHRQRIQRQTSQWSTEMMIRCLDRGVNLRRGVLAQMLGPTYETRAEVHMLRSIGADVVGMSTAIEARQAWQFGIETMILSLVTNTLSDTVLPKLDHHDVLTASRSAGTSLQKALHAAFA